jgi:uncharacterized UBP type Zn finger protein
MQAVTADVSSSDAPTTKPAVAGLHNLGNTCYLNAALQAMASSKQFTSCIGSMAQAFEVTAAPEPHQKSSWVQQLGEGLAAAARFVWSGKGFCWISKGLSGKI